MPEAAESNAALSLDVSAIASGADQTGVRLYNERLLLSLGAPVRTAFQSRSCAHDGPLGPVGLRDHEPAAGRRPAAPRSALARARRTADHPGFARSRGRVLARIEDRPTQLRSRADRLLRRGAPARAQDLRLSDARSRDGLRRRRLAARHVVVERGAAAPHRRARRRFAVSIVELGGRDRRAKRRDGCVAVVLDWRGDRRASARSR